MSQEPKKALPTVIPSTHTAVEMERLKQMLPIPQEIKQQLALPIDPFKRTKDKCYIVGFAPSWKLTPWDDQDAEIWCLNEFYKLMKDVPNSRADRWFEIHSKDSPSKNVPEHIAFLQKCPVPLYMQDKYDEMPNSVKFPYEQVMKYLKDKEFIGYKFFTNTISWMFAMAMWMGFKEIHIYGVDMATKTEYASQKPSCHYFMGLAEGMGIKVYVPEECDLLKCGLLYGFESDNQMRVKMKTRKKELQERAKTHQASIEKLKRQIEQEHTNMMACMGAVDDTNFYLENWII